jgi:Uroporphyrinogen-III decarboxylase
MTDRQRFINCVLGKPIDRVPFICYFGPWGETLERWRGEGAEGDTPWLNGDPPYDRGVVSLTSHCRMLYNPPFTTEMIEEKGERYIFRDSFGIIAESIKGKSGIPKIIKNPVLNRADWLDIKRERLSCDIDNRFTPDFEQCARGLYDNGYILQIGDYPYGLFGTLRDMIGIENLCVMFYDEPDLIHEIMDYLTDLWLKIYAEAVNRAQIDVIHIWEDMSGKSGSLISPDMIREFMSPNYKRIKEFAVKHNIPVMSLDTDGICDELIGVFGESGINLMLPFEVAAGNDIKTLRQRFPFMAMLGGIDKLEIEKGKIATDRQLQSIKPLLSGSGYIPNLDHLIHPGISYDDYLYFKRSLWDAISDSAKL